MDWLLRTYGGVPTDWLRQPPKWVRRLLALRNYRHDLPRGGDG